MVRNSFPRMRAARRGSPCSSVSRDRPLRLVARRLRSSAQFPVDRPDHLAYHLQRPRRRIRAARPCASSPDESFATIRHEDTGIRAYLGDTCPKRSVPRVAATWPVRHSDGRRLYGASDTRYPWIVEKRNLTRAVLLRARILATRNPDAANENDSHLSNRVN